MPSLTSLIPWPYRWLILAVLMAAVGGFGYVKGLHSGERKLDAYKLSEAKQSIQIQAATIAKTQALQHQKDEALNAANERAKLAQAAADSAHATGDGLRRDLSDAQRKLSSASVDAVRKYATTLGAVFDECSAEVERLAKAAAGHASDTLTLEQSWPKP